MPRAWIILQRILEDYAKIATSLNGASFPHFATMKDTDIRQVVLLDLEREYESDPDTIIIEELGLCQGEARVDIAVVNGSIHGFEIKSDRDTLKRLPGQVQIYNRSLDSVTLVVGSKHLDNALKVIPKWWGVIEAKKRDQEILTRIIRPYQKNPSPDPEAIVQLIWRNEALGVLRKRNLHKGYVSKKKWILWERIMEKLPIDLLKEEVRTILKSRQNWRSAEPQA